MRNFEEVALKFVAEICISNPFVVILRCDGVDFSMITHDST